MPRSNFAPWGSISLIESTCFRGQCLCRVWGPGVPESPQEKLLPNKSKKQTIMVEATGISEFSLKFTPTCQILDFTKASINPKRSYRIQIQKSTWVSLHVILKSNHVKQPLAPPLHLAFAASFLFMVSVHPCVLITPFALWALTDFLLPDSATVPLPPGSPTSLHYSQIP